MLITFLLLVIALLVGAVIWLSTWYGTVHPRYERKYLHQQKQLHEAAATNYKLRREREALVLMLKETERDRDGYKHVAHDYYRKWKRGGGEETIRTVTKTVTTNPFTRDELTILIQLCHPDKHGGKPSANAMTQKLNQLRSTTK